MEAHVPDSTAQTYKQFIWESLKVLAVAGITVFFVRYFLFKPFYVKGASMEPTFLENEYLIIDELSFRFRQPIRGEIVVFKHDGVEKDYYIKRIIGLPGERVKVSDGKVTVYNQSHPEGVIIDESYLPSDLLTLGEKNVSLGDNEYFVLGDNRMNSFDSRGFGPVDKSAIVGRVLVRGWPLKRAQSFSAPAFNF
jgi:signal peptidase I